MLACLCFSLPPAVSAGTRERVPGFEVASFAFASYGQPDEGMKMGRYWLVNGGYEDQMHAVADLIRHHDQDSIARVVYAFRQGDRAASDMLFTSATLDVVPYLLEDMAHGNTEPLQGTRFVFEGSLRREAIELAVEALTSTRGFSHETSDWLGYMSRGSGSMESCIEKSKLLIDWWKHNQKNLEEGKLKAATWLPDPRRTDRALGLSPPEGPPAPPPPPPPPPPDPEVPKWAKTPLPLAESFDAWYARVRDHKRLDLTFVDVRREGDTWVPRVMAVSGVVEPKKEVSAQVAPGVLGQEFSTLPLILAAGLGLVILAAGLVLLLVRCIRKTWR